MQSLEPKTEYRILVCLCVCVSVCVCVCVLSGQVCDMHIRIRVFATSADHNRRLGNDHDNEIYTVHCTVQVVYMCNVYVQYRHRYSVR